MSRWSENRGVWDDLCYLRQAHLFERFGLKGLDTDVRLDDDGYFRELSKSAGLGNEEYVCHQLMPKTGKQVMQYPPGVGAVLAIFPKGSQVKSLFIATTALVAIVIAASILVAPTLKAILIVALFGTLSIYMMINPTKSSYSMAPTTILCIAASFITVRILTEARASTRFMEIILLGFILGLSVNMRIPNVLLVSGYLLILGALFLKQPSTRTFLNGSTFTFSFVAGMIPTLAANYVNAGSPFSTTYGPGDTAANEFSLFPMLKRFWDYMIMTQGQLIVGSIILTVLLYRKAPAPMYRTICLLIGLNLSVSLIFFSAHILMTPYYLMPIVT